MKLRRIDIKIIRLIYKETAGGERLTAQRCQTIMPGKRVSRDTVRYWCKRYPLRLPD